MYVEGIGSLPWGRRKRNSCPLLHSLLLSSLLLFFFFFSFALWYPSPLLLRNPFVVSPGLWLSWLHSPSPDAWILLVLYAQSSSLGTRETIKHAVPSESAATCPRWRWLWGSGLQALGRLAKEASAVLIQLTSFARTVRQHLQSDFRKNVSGKRSCHRNREKWKSHQGCSSRLLSYRNKDWAALPQYCCIGSRNVAHSQVIFAQTEDQRVDPSILLIGGRNRKGQKRGLHNY